MVSCTVLILYANKPGCLLEVWDRIDCKCRTYLLLSFRGKVLVLVYYRFIQIHIAGVKRILST